MQFHGSCTCTGRARCLSRRNSWWTRAWIRRPPAWDGRSMPDHRKGALVHATLCCAWVVEFAGAGLPGDRLPQLCRQAGAVQAAGGACCNNNKKSGRPTTGCESQNQQKGVWGHLLLRYCKENIAKPWAGTRWSTVQGSIGAGISSLLMCTCGQLRRARVTFRASRSRPRCGARRTGRVGRRWQRCRRWR